MGTMERRGRLSVTCVPFLQRFNVGLLRVTDRSHVSLFTAKKATFRDNMNEPAHGDGSLYR